MGRLAFYINSSTCIGCKACELACKDKNDLQVGPRPRRAYTVSGGSWTTDEGIPGTVAQTGVYSYSLSIACNHCETPACYGACPLGAIDKDPDTGIVTINEEKCNGCGACYEACPYGAPQIVEAEQTAKKCDFCKALLDKGEDPSCVEICPMRALKYGEYDDLVAEYGDVADMVPLPDSKQTGPSLVITPHKDAKYKENEGVVLSL